MPSFQSSLKLASPLCTQLAKPTWCVSASLWEWCRAKGGRANDSSVPTLAESRFTAAVFINLSQSLLCIPLFHIVEDAPVGLDQVLLLAEVDFEGSLDGDKGNASLPEKRRAEVKSVNYLPFPSTPSSQDKHWVSIPYRL